MENKTTTLNYQLSFWEKDVFFKKIDFTIIGAGLIGLNAALRLRELEPKAKIVVVDRVGIPIGASTRNAGFACIGSVSELLEDLTNMSEEAVFELVHLRMNGLQRLRKKLGDQAIQYEHLGGFELFTAKDHSQFDICASKITYLNKLLKDITGVKNTFQIEQNTESIQQFQNVNNIIINHAEGQLHPGKMMQALMKKCKENDIELIGGIQIDKIHSFSDHHILLTSAGWSFKTANLIVATNGFSKLFFPDLDIHPARNQVLITHPIPHLNINGCFHYDRGYFYFRNVGNRILMGGGRNLDPMMEKTTTFGHTPIIKEALVNLLQNLLGSQRPFEVAHWWSGILGVGAVKAPIVEVVKQNMVAAVRMGGMGVAIGTIIGEQAAELAIGKGD